MAWRILSHRGPRSGARVHGGCSGTRETSSSPGLMTPGAGNRDTKAQAGAAHRRARPWSEHADGGLGPLREGNEARRGRRRGVGALDTTCEAGEPTRWDPAEESERRDHMP